MFNLEFASYTAPLVAGLAVLGLLVPIALRWSWRVRPAASGVRPVRRGRRGRLAWPTGGTGVRRLLTAWRSRGSLTAGWGRTAVADLPGADRELSRTDVSPSGHDPEPRLPAQVVIDCRWYGSFFHGRCGRGNHGGPELTVRGVTVRGGVHAVTETEGQDVTGAAWQARTGTLFVAVADGLGSLPRSARMAREAVRAALHLCMTKPDDLAFEAAGHRFFGAVAAGLRRSLGAEAADDGGTTLLVAEVVADERGARVTVHGVGDSEAWALDGQGWHPMHHERDGVGTDGGNVTRDLPTDPRPRTQRYRLPPGAVLVLATDGFAENLQPGGSAWSHHLAARWYGPPRPVDFVRLVTAVGGELSDDRGVVAVWIGR